MADALVTFGTTGIRLVPLRSTKTDAVSERYFLLAAEHVVLEPCALHTPREADAICGECGRIDHGLLLDYFHVPRPDVAELSLFSRHRFGLSDLYFARDLYERLRAAGIGSLLVSLGLDTCDHDARSAPSIVTPAVVPSIAEPELPSSEIDAFFEHLEDPRPQFVCGACGGGADETFDVTHRIEPGCTARELDAVASKFPDAHHLRALYERADGMLLYCDVRDRAHAFPSLAATRRGEVEGDSFIRFERANDWHRLRAEMLANMEMMESGFVAKDGLPFARISGSSDLLVCAAGAVYYFSSAYNPFHAQVIAQSVEELLARIARDPAAFVMDTAAVARFGGTNGLQYFPRRYLSGR
jgi:hypothetical protein